ncbi:MAG: DUF362 domain-containing protein [Bryobacterales bacterium]|nr:DUF362 domain-containing protein [Bryobacterales bacterium]
MMSPFSRRALFGGAAGLLVARGSAASSTAAATKSPVALVHGEDRRKNITEALRAIDREIAPQLKRRKSVIIKPNLVSTNRQLAATHADALRGILDYLDTRWRGPVYIAESSAGDTFAGYENFKYSPVAGEYKRMNVSLVDLNEEALYKTIHILNGDLHPQAVRLAERLLDPDAFVISAGVMKTHNVVVATMSIKNMTLGAPLHNKKGEKRWNDKRVYHGGVRQTHYGIVRTAERMKANWGVAVIDGYEGMEGNGPSSGTPVDSRIAIASPDFLSADRIGVECMGIDAGWPAYLNWCGEMGVGNYDLARIEVRGNAIDAVRKPYQMHGDIDRELQWMGPLTELPPKLG